MRWPVTKSPRLARVTAACVRGLVLIGVFAGLLLLATAARAQSVAGEKAWPQDTLDMSDASPWLSTGLIEPVYELFAPRSGAFYARTASGLQRSNDAGATWQPVHLPVPSSELGAVAVDPSNHSHVLVEGPTGIFQTVDDAQTWSMMYPLQQRSVLNMAISPADSKWIYIGLRGGSGVSPGMGDLWFVRTTDGGATFTVLEQGSGTTCAMSMPVIEPHHNDPRTLFRSVACLAGRTFGTPLAISSDGGMTYRYPLSVRGFPRQVVGGQGTTPERWYARVVADQRVGGASLYRTADNGLSWQPILEYHTDYDANGLPVPPNVTIAAVTYDAAQPDNVWVALAGDGEGIQFSADGGDTWQDAGAHDVGRATSLVLGIDGRNLYLATDRGLWRQPQPV